jgi:ribonuclease E
MAKKMLIDATHAEETRVVVVDGNKVEEFDFESENKRQIAGNIYLAKVTRVEPSLQAAFVDYGGNRHGFLAFSEIHADYYQIPQADRDALLAEELAYAKAQEEEDEKPKRTRRRRSRGRSKAEETKSDDAVAVGEIVEEGSVEAPETDAADAPVVSGMDVVEPEASDADDLITEDVAAEVVGTDEGLSPALTVADTPVEEPAEEAGAETAPVESASTDAVSQEGAEDAAVEADAQVETASEQDESIENDAEDDETFEDVRPARKPRPRRYKIQEVIKVRQILLIQVVKEERGNKGAALTTYLSLAGRYCVLMPNTARGGGISRKITNAADRKKLKEIANEMDVPQGAGLIVRTAGAQRTGTEITRDYEYLKRMWEQIRELTLKSIAPAKIYEEGDLIKRSIRDLYSNEIDEVIVEGDAGFRTAKDFMAMIMPTHAKNVTNYKENLPLFARFQVESYLGSMFNPTVQLKSGGYIVIDVTEALVAVDVNSGRATKEGSIEDTAFKTNMEAAEELARQARLRDLAGLIVIDFIDMEERRNNTAVEKRLKDKLKTDRARIQVGRISSFGLLEMSRQRLRPGMLEATTQPCHHCHGTGLIRSDDNMALTILRQLEEEGTRRRSKEVLLRAPIAIINYLFNFKREKIAQIEDRYGMAVRMEADPHMISPDFTIEKFKTATRVIVEKSSAVISASAALMDDIDVSEPADVIAEDAVDAVPGETDGEEQPKKRRRRRRRRRKSGDQVEGQENDQENGEEGAAQQEGASETSDDDAVTPDVDDEVEKPKRTRTRRSRSRKTDDTATPEEAPVSENETAVDAETDADTDAVTEKPKRTRTRRKKTDVASEVSTPDSAETSVPAADEEAVEKPKRTRTRRKKSEPEVIADADAQGEAKVDEAKVDVAPVSGEGEAAVEKPKRAPRKRKTKAEREAEEAVKAAAAEPVVGQVTEPVAAQPEPAAVPVEPVLAEVAVIEAAPVVEVAAVDATPAEEKETKPKRRGWWSLGG